jgi:hypothetical protein
VTEEGRFDEEQRRREAVLLAVTGAAVVVSVRAPERLQKDPPTHVLRRRRIGERCIAVTIWTT